MDRRKFLRNTALGVVATGTGASLLANETEATPKTTKEVGFNHIPAAPSEQIKNKHMKAVLHRANTRGHANHGWLDSHHSFSFASYYNPERMNFGVLRVLNDDRVAGGMGFGKHPHDNMEIISIPLEGDLEHKDSMGNTFTIRKNDVQVMSAGTGIFHSEKNKHDNEEVKFLQIWVMPKTKNVTPRYDQLSFDPAERSNKLQQVVSPNKDDEGAWIHQDAWFHLGNANNGKVLSYDVKKAGNGLYLFVLEGSVRVGEHVLHRRDAIGVTEVRNLSIEAQGDADFLLMEIPMSL